MYFCTNGTNTQIEGKTLNPTGKDVYHHCE